MPKPDKDRNDTESSSDLQENEEEHQGDVDDDDDTRPAVTKRREGPDNLRRRSEWFQKRTGGER